MNKLPESVLISKALEGDRAAFRQLVEESQTMVYRVAYRFLRNHHDAEDITQEVYVKMFRNLKKFNPGNKLTTWLYRITVNCCLDFLKSSRRKQEYTSLDGLDMEAGISPEQLYENDELSKLLVAAANLLTPMQKAVFILRDLEGLTTEETGNTLSIKSNNVKSTLFLARKRVSEILKTYKSNAL